MNYELRILKRAEEDVRTIFEWLEEQSPSGARKWLEAFDSAAQRLRSNPFLWPTAPENSLVDYEVRNFVFKTRRGRKYRALYTVIDNEVRILHVRGARQDLLSKLEPPEDA